MNNKIKKLLILNIPYLFIALFLTKVSQAWRYTTGFDLGQKILNLLNGFELAFNNPLPSLYPKDLLFGIAMGVILRLIVYIKSKNAKKYRKGIEYGSARWGSSSDIGQKISTWFHSDGIHISKGETALYSRSKEVINWTDVAKRIEELLNDGQYVTQDILDHTGAYERKEIAETLWYLHRDLSDDIKNQIFNEEIFKDGFPDSTNHIALLLEDTNEREMIIKSLQEFNSAYEQDPTILRFHFHKPQELLSNLRYRYVHNFTWEQIGDELNADKSTIRRWHGNALNHVIVPENPITIQKLNSNEHF